MLQAEQQLLLDLMGNQLTGKPYSIPDDMDVSEFIVLCQAHKLAPFAYCALSAQADFPAQALHTLEQACDHAVFLDAQFDYLKASISQMLTQNRIDHVLLRGIHLKQLYPVPALRTMSDMDILVHSQDLPVIGKIMEQLGAVRLESDGNHRTFLFPDLQAEVEFHPNLIHPSCPVATGVNPGWQYVPQGQAPGQQQMTPEGFYISILSHLASHFVSGGAGIRFIMDIWVCRHLAKEQPNQEKLDRELSRIGLLDFSRQIDALAEHWFSGLPGKSEELERYVITSGSHGILSRATLNAVALSGTRGNALWRKVFYPREDLENRYDWVIGRPWLLPAAWAVRSFRAVSHRGHLIRKWHWGTKAPTAEEITRQKAMLKRFGIESNFKNR